MHLLQLGASAEIPQGSAVETKVAVLHGLVASGSLLSAKEHLSKMVPLDAETPVHLKLDVDLLTYRIDPTRENAEKYLGLARSVDLGGDLLASAALEHGCVDHALLALPTVQDALLVGRIKTSASKQNVVKAIRDAPWSADLWLELAEEIFSENNPAVDVEPRIGNGKRVKWETCHAAATNTLALTAAQNPEMQCLGGDLFFRAMSAQATFYFMTNQTSLLFSKAARLFYSYPYENQAIRLFAYAALAHGLNFDDAKPISLNDGSEIDAQSNPKECLCIARSKFRMLLDQNKGSLVNESHLQPLLDKAGLCEAMLGLGESIQELATELANEAAACGAQQTQALAHVYIGRSSLQAGNVAACQEAFHKALMVCPRAPLLWIELGQIAFDSGNVQLASFCFESSAASLDKETESKDDAPDQLLLDRTSKVLNALYIAETAGTVKCLGKMNRIAKDWPADVNVHIIRGWLCLLTGDKKNKKNAASSFQTALCLEPQNALALDLMNKLENSNQ